MLPHLLRLFRRHALFAVINLIGLAVGMAGFLFVALYLQGELTVDRGFAHADRTYRLANTLTLPGREPIFAVTTAPDFAGPLRDAFPEIEAMARMALQRVELRLDGDVRHVEPVLWVDPNFLDVLDLPWIAGDRAGALARPDGIVLTPALAEKLFGAAGDGALGRTVQLADGTVLRVTGIVADLGSRSHLAYAALIPDMVRGPAAFDRRAAESSTQGGASIYLRLAEGADPEAVRARLAEFVDRHAKGLPPKEWAPDFLRLRLDPLTDIHLHVKAADDPKAGGSAGTVRVLAGVALLILGIALVNYTNLATAQAIRRAKEVGVRKVAGARRRHLVALFIGESVATTVAATVLATGLLELLMPMFNELVGRTLNSADLWRGPLLAVLVAAPVLAGVAGGLYPAQVLSGYRPAEVLKGRAQAPGSGRLRAILVVAQFTVSIVLVIATLTVQRQVDHARSAELGFDRENLYVVAPRQDMQDRAPTLAAELAGLPGVVSVSRSGIVPASRTESISSVSIIGRETAGAFDDPTVSQFVVDPAFLSTYGMKLVAGPGLPEGWGPGEAPIDPEDGRPMEAAGGFAIITETAVKRLGFASPEAAIGQQLGIGPDGLKLPTRIVGVAQDLRLRSARTEPEAIVLTFGLETEFITLRIAAADPRPVVAAISAVVDRIMPDSSKVKRFFLEDEIEAMYREDERQARVFATFSVLAILLANMGLFGLTALAAANRTKEIGIRRVVGASVPQVVTLLAGQFLRPVVLSNLIAWPVAWVLLDRWLGQFSVRIDLGAGPFLLAAGTALAVALVTVTVHATRVALVPPARALRYE